MVLVLEWKPSGTALEEGKLLKLVLPVRVVCFCELKTGPLAAPLNHRLEKGASVGSTSS